MPRPSHELLAGGTADVDERQLLRYQQASDSRSTDGSSISLFAREAIRAALCFLADIIYRSRPYVEWHSYALHWCLKR